MTIRSIARNLQGWKRRPRFNTPGLGLALVLFLAAALLMILTRGSTAPAPSPRPAPPASPASPARAPKLEPVPLPVPSSIPVPEPAPVETRAGCPQGCDVPPPGCTIKGNLSWDGEKIYHRPGWQSYHATEIDPGRGERWFCTEEEARANGWRRSKHAPKE